MSKPVKLSDGEWTVMHSLWRRHRGTTRDVLGDVGDETGWAYTTVKTILDRLVEKGVLRAGRQGNAAVYEPLLTRDQARRRALHSLVDRAFGGTIGSLLQHMVQQERLSRRDREALTEMLGERDAPGRNEP